MFCILYRTMNVLWSWDDRRYHSTLPQRCQAMPGGTSGFSPLKQENNMPLDKSRPTRYNNTALYITQCYYTRWCLCRQSEKFQRNRSSTLRWRYCVTMAFPPSMPAASPKNWAAPRSDLLFIQEHGRTEGRADAACDRTAHTARAGFSARPRGEQQPLQQLRHGLRQIRCRGKQLFRWSIWRANSQGHIKAMF